MNLPNNSDNINGESGSSLFCFYIFGNLFCYSWIVLILLKKQENGMFFPIYYLTKHFFL